MTADGSKQWTFPHIAKDYVDPVVDPKNITQIQIQEGVNYTPETFCFNSCNRSPHLLGFLVWFFFWASVICFFVFISWLIAISFILISLSVICYIVEFFVEKTFRYLWNFNPVQSFSEEVEKIRATDPSIGFGCECYHYETRTVYVTERDAQGNTHTVARTYTEKVVTHRETEYFRYRVCRDVSGDLTKAILQFNAIRVDFTKSWNAGNAETQMAYDRTRSSFISRNIHRDVHFDQWDIFELPGFKQHMLSVVDIEQVPAGLHLCVYMFFGVLFQAVWYRHWLDRVTVLGKYHITKSLFV